MARHTVLEMESLKAPARRRLGAIARGLRTGHAAAVTSEPTLPQPPPMPEQGSVAAEGLELLRDADVQRFLRFLVDGFLLIQPSSLSSASSPWALLPATSPVAVHGSLGGSLGGSGQGTCCRAPGGTMCCLHSSKRSAFSKQ